MLSTRDNKRTSDDPVSLFQVESAQSTSQMRDAVIRRVVVAVAVAVAHHGLRWVKGSSKEGDGNWRERGGGKLKVYPGLQIY